MAEGEDTDSGEKPHEATPRKLEEARKRGDLPRSSDLTATAAIAGLLALALVPGGWVLPRIGALGAVMLDQADPMSRTLVAGGAAASGGVLAALAIAVAPVFLVPAAMVLAALFALRGLVFAPEKLEPKLSRISLVANAKQKFGPSGLFEFSKNAVKLTLYGALLWLFLAFNLSDLIATIGQSPGQVSVVLFQMMLWFLALLLVVMAVIGAVDYLWQVFDHARRQRMSHKDLMDEFRQSEGDPHVKQNRRQRATEIATNRMLADVPRADVVIVNPTHYAVALRWDRKSPHAPVCVAKGMDAVAARIREVAAEAGVPLHSDPPTARALHANVEIGAAIGPEHYAPVAAAIRFAEAMRQKARGKHRPAPPPPRN
jgi:flagellar biosynthesis protein FlhB